MAEKFNIFGKGGSSASSGMVMRTVYFTVCEGYELDERNGKSKDFADTLIGKYTPMRATRHFNRTNPNHHIKVTKTTIYKQLVGMDFWDYWQYATPSYDPIQTAQYILNNKVE